jgi:hypothetical protein
MEIVNWYGNNSINIGSSIVAIDFLTNWFLILSSLISKSWILLHICFRLFSSFSMFCRNAFTFTHWVSFKFDKTKTSLLCQFFREVAPQQIRTYKHNSLWIMSAVLPPEPAIREPSREYGGYLKTCVIQWWKGAKAKGKVKKVFLLCFGCRWHDSEFIWVLKTFHNFSEFRQSWFVLFLLGFWLVCGATYWSIFIDITLTHPYIFYTMWKCLTLLGKCKLP